MDLDSLKCLEEPWCTFRALAGIWRFGPFGAFAWKSLWGTSALRLIGACLEHWLVLGVFKIRAL